MNKLIESIYPKRDFIKPAKTGSSRDDIKHQIVLLEQTVSGSRSHSRYRVVSVPAADSLSAT